jgi:hypothetical protein
VCIKNAARLVAAVYDPSTRFRLHKYHDLQRLGPGMILYVKFLYLRKWVARRAGVDLGQGELRLGAPVIT